MSYDPSVVIRSEVVASITPLPYLNVALATFTPSTAPFLAGFIANAEFEDPNTLEGLASVMTINNYASRLRAWGAEPDEPIWQQLDAYFTPLAAVADGVRPPVDKPPRVVIGRRTRSAPWEQTIEFTTNTAGTVRITVNPSVQLFSDGYLAQVDIVADGVLTVTDLRDAAVLALNAVPEFAALYLAAPVGILGIFTITSLADGFPLVCKVTSTTGGPIMTNAVTTANVAGDYELDLDDIQTAAELSDDPVTGKPERRYYWITDTQGDDDVNAEGFEWVQDQGELSPARDYQFHGLSHSPLNFDPLSAGTSPAEVAAAANGGIGWNRGSVCDHDLYEWPVMALFGRTIGYLPGDISFTDKQLRGSLPESKITPRDKGDNASLADERHFNYNSPEGPLGSWRWGWLADGSYWDRKWLEDYATYTGQLFLTNFKIQRNIVAFTNDDINAGASVINRALLTIPGIAVLPDLISITAVQREALDPNDIATRTYTEYTVSCGYGGVINRFGTIASSIVFTIVEAA